MRKIFTFLIILCITSFAYGQTRTISGTIMGGDSNETLPGVSVVIQGTTTGTISDFDGKYIISANKGDILVFSYVGYLSETMEVGDASQIDMVLVPDIQDLDEVVVIGYGKQKKSLVTGSIAKISSEEIVKSPVLRAEQAIQGRTSGVTVTQSSGQPGSGFTVRVRGTGSNSGSEPIYVVDGMRMGGIESVNLNDIESIEILKDAASAAIYGAQGANGVVLITTKSGKKGDAKVNYKFYFGIQDLANKKFSVLDRNDYLDYRWRALTAEGIDNATISDPAGTYHLPLPGSEGTNTNWIGEVFAPAPMVEHNLSVSGGGEKSTYVFSTSYFSQDGIAGGDKANYTRYSARFNAEHQVKEWLSIGNKITYNHSKRTSLPENNLFNNFMNRAINMDPLTQVTVDNYSDLPGFVQIQQPEYVVKDGDGRYYGISNYVGGEVFNPLAASEVNNGAYLTDKILGSVNADLKPIEGLMYRTKFDFEIAYGNNNYWSPKTYFNLENDNPQNGVGSSFDKWTNWQWGNYITYDFNLQDHNFSVLGGMEARQENYRALYGFGSNMEKESPEFAFINNTVDSLSRANDAINEVKWLSYFGRINYNLHEKYLASFVLRRDGSSLYGPENQYGIFPSVSFGWVISKEDFWNIDWFNFLKYRASWGMNGSTSNLAPNQWRGLITQAYQYPNASGQLLPVSEPEVNSNPNLKWEASEQLDLGFDMAFFNNKLTFNTDYYRKITRDLLTKATDGAIYGNYNTYVNAGDVLNTGIEVELGYKYTQGDFNFKIDLNAAYNYNEVLSTGDADVLEGTTLHLEDGPITRFRVNYPVWYYSAYKTDGIFQTDEEAANYRNVADIRYQANAKAGDVKFVDINRDGTINSEDRVMVGDPNPDWILGANISIDYKNFDLSLFIQGAFGHQVVNALNRSDRFGYNKPQFYYDDAWEGEGSTNDWFRPSELDPNGNFRNSDLFVNDASFVRLKNMQLGYNFGNLSFLRDYGIDNARIFVSAQNLLTLTKYKGLEPEIGAVAGPSAVGIDYGFYPSARIFQFGFNVIF